MTDRNPSAADLLRRRQDAEPAPPGTTAVLIVSGSYSTCGHCRQQTLPDAAAHDAISGYGPPGRGCGARFTAIASDRVRIDDELRAVLARMRPDLPVVDPWTPAPGGEE